MLYIEIVYTQKTYISLKVLKCAGVWLKLQVVGPVLNLFPNFVKQVHKRIVDHERNRHIQTHATQTRHRALVEGSRSLVLQYLQSTIRRVLVLGRLQSLHSRLHHIQWRVAKNGCSAGNGTESAYKKFWHWLVGIVAL